MWRLRCPVPLAKQAFVQHRWSRTGRTCKNIRNGTFTPRQTVPQGLLCQLLRVTEMYTVNSPRFCLRGVVSRCNQRCHLYLLYPFVMVHTYSTWQRRSILAILMASVSAKVRRHQGSVCSGISQDAVYWRDLKHGSTEGKGSSKSVKHFPESNSGGFR